MLLDQIVKDEINSRGLISFSDFMNTCLYYPDLGYYMNEREKIGIQGDFFTSCSLSASFGAMIGRELEEMWHILGEHDFTVVEYGAGTGMLCHDILAYLKGNPELYERLRYCIIEISPFMVKTEKRHLHDKVFWFSSIEDIEGEIDCVLSNELLDNFPVHQVVMKEALYEVFVTYDNGFKEILLLARSELKEYLEALRISLPEGFRTEINLQAVRWIGDVASRLNRGFIITIDYGGESADLYKNHRSCGTLMCYHDHTMNEQPYCNIGQQDITAHVNFSALQHWGAINGLTTCGITNQAMFLLSLGFRNHLEHCAPQKGKSMFEQALEVSRIMQRLLLEMGPRFKVLVQSKNIPSVQLSCFTMI